MKNQIFFSVLILLLTTSFLSAQSYDEQVVWGKQYKEPGNSEIVKIVENFPHGLFVIRTKSSSLGSDDGAGPQTVFIESYNDRMGLIKANEIKLKFNGKKRKLEDLILLNEKLYLITSFHNRSHEKNYLFAQEIRMKSLTIGKRLDKIGEINAESHIRGGDFDIKISSDSSKLLVYNAFPYKRKKSERFTLSVYNSDFEEIWIKEISLPYADKNFNIEEYQIDNKGNVHLAGIVFEDDSNFRRQGKPDYQYLIMSYLNNGSIVKEYPINLGDQFISDLTFRMNNEGELVCAGFYSAKGTYSVKGTFSFLIDPLSGDVLKENKKPFDFEFLTMGLSERGVRKAQKAKERGDDKKAPELSNFSLDHLILREDGSAILIAEQFFVYQQRDNYGYDPFYGGFGFNRNSFRNRNNVSVDYVYNYNDIIIVNINPSGEIEWSSLVPKRQVTTNDGGYYSSYSLLSDEDNFYFIFNDNIKNYSADRKEDKIYRFSGRSAIVSLAKVNINGKVRLSPLYAKDEVDVVTMPKLSKQITSNTLLLYGESDRHFRFGTLNF